MFLEKKKQNKILTNKPKLGKPQVHYPEHNIAAIVYLIIII